MYGIREFLKEAIEQRDANRWANLLQEEKELPPAVLMGLVIEGPTPVEGFDFRRLDLSGVVFNDVEIVDCRFGCISGLRTKCVTFQSCQFGAEHNDNVVDVVFDDTTWRGTTFTSLHFYKCQFISNRLGDPLGDARRKFWILPPRGAKTQSAVKGEQAFILANKCSFKESTFFKCSLTKAIFYDCRFYSTRILDGDLRAARLIKSEFDEESELSAEEVDYDTQISLRKCDARLSPKLQAALRRNRLYAYWQDRYQSHFVATLPVRAFLSLVGYGQASLWRLVALFFGVIVFFAQLYLAPLYANLYLGENEFNPLLKDEAWPYGCGDSSINRVWVVITANIRAVYFSTIVVTTLGFGDIAATPTHSGFPSFLFGHLFVFLEVLVGYMLYSAILARLLSVFQEGIIDEYSR